MVHIRGGLFLILGSTVPPEVVERRKGEGWTLVDEDAFNVLLSKYKEERNAKKTKGPVLVGRDSI